MIIDGKAVAESIHQRLKIKVDHFVLEHDSPPTLAVIMVGNRPDSMSYVKQKQKAADKLGIRIIIEHLASDAQEESVSTYISRYNNDPTCHGLIIQRPLPPSFSQLTPLGTLVLPKKDVDGFVSNTLFVPPVAAAVIELLRSVRKDQIDDESAWKEELFIGWLKSQTIAVIGRGETAGEPITHHLKKLQCATSIIHSQTPNPRDILRTADIIISCVGKEHTVVKDDVKKDAILISVGLTKGADGLLHGDYDEEEIQDVASYYTPTPGGVGPVNVACLMKNVVEAAQSAYKTVTEEKSS